MTRIPKGLMSRCSLCRRIAIRVLEGVSLIMLLVISALWAARESWQPSIRLGYEEGWTRDYSVASLPIGVQFQYYSANGKWEWLREEDKPERAWSFRFAARSGYLTDYPRSWFKRSLLGFRLGVYSGTESIPTPTYSFDGEVSQCELLVPHWFLAAAAAIIPILRLGRLHRRYRRRRRGMCVKCGYDLRATKNRCPECGTPCESEAGHATG